MKRGDIDMAAGTPIDIINVLYPIAYGVSVYFLKKTMDRLDKAEDKVNKIEKDYVTETAHSKSLDKIENELKSVKEDIKDMSSKFLTKEDFFREQAKTDKKLEKITDILMEIKEGK